MWSSAIKDAVEKIRKNMDTFGTRFPHVSRDGAYLLNDNDDWTNGFWSGLLWLCYEYTGDEAFQLGAKRTVEDFRRRFAEKRCLIITISDFCIPCPPKRSGSLRRTRAPAN